MSVKKPENFYEFCDSLNKPYALAKQYFDQTILEIDIYNDSQYFYEWFSSLNDKSQDTVYNNLQRLYDVTKETVDYSLAQLKKKIPTKVPSKVSDEEFINIIEKSLTVLKEFSDESIKRSKLSILNQLLATADAFKRTLGAVEVNECDRRCNEHNKRYDEISKSKKTILVISVLTSIIVSSALMLILLYCFALARNDSFIKFVDENLMGLFLGFLGSLAGSIILMYFKIIKDS